MIEQEGKLRESWYAAGLSEDIKLDQPYRAVIYEIPLVIWRSQKGLAAFVDSCMHRNAPLSEGKIVNDGLVCPYHGWTYDQSGACSKIPSEGPHFTVPKVKLKSFAVRESGGLVWVWMGAGQVDKEPFPMPWFEDKGWRKYYMVTHFDNNVTDLVENFMDVPHTVFVHKGWFRDKAQIAIKTKVQRTADSVLVEYDQPNDSVGYLDRLINPRREPITHTDKFFMPNTTRVDYNFGSTRSFIITSTCTPEGPFQTKVYTLITYKFDWLNPIVGLFMPWYTRKVIGQDVWIMKIQGDNLKQLKQARYLSTPADAMHVYIESLRNFARKSGGEGSLEPVEKEMEFWI